MSVYCQYSLPVEVFTEQMSRVLEFISSRSVIIGADVNGISPLWNWSSFDTDAKGQLIEEFIAAHDLDVVNTPGQPCTFTKGNRSIDITLAGADLVNHIQTWNVREEWTTSDHLAITYEIGTNEAPTVRTKKRRFNVARANWPAFKNELNARATSLVGQVLDDRDRIENLVKDITSAIITSAKKSIPKKKNRKKAIPWWNQELTMKKRSLYRLRKTYQRERNEATRLDLGLSYRTMRNQYKIALSLAREASWRKYVEEEGNKDPYSKLYRIANDKLSPVTTLTNLEQNGVHTKNWADTAALILEGLFGTEEEQGSEDVQYYRENDSPMWTEIEVREAIMSLRNRKAPGQDMIEVEMVKCASRTLMLSVITKLYNACLTQGNFPHAWKEASVKVLLKGLDKDPSIIKSYRPICLLPILSKVLEKLIKERIGNQIMHANLTSEKQYGYKTGKGTEEAILEMKRIVVDSEESMVLALLFDISGAFDNLRWSKILAQLRDRDCPSNIYRLIRSYLSNRSVTLVDKFETITRKICKGCPQGSIVGPDFWNMCMDELLLRLESAGADVVAYADDIVVLVKGNSRRQLELKGQQFTDIIVQWSTEQGLTISKTKTEMIMLKDAGAGKQAGKVKATDSHGTHKRKQGVTGSSTRSLVKTGTGGRRPPSIKIDGTPIKYKDSVKYLGVTVETRFKMNKHIETVGAKSKKLFEKLRRIAKHNWGLKSSTLTTIYKTVFLPVMLYAIGAWGDALCTNTINERLQKHQRYPLIVLTKAYRTASTNALQIIAGQKPLDLEAKERYYKYKVRKKIPFAIGTIEYDGRTDDKVMKKELEKSIIEEWQNRWNQSDKGQVTRKFFPSVEERLERIWLETDYHVTQFLSGHGDFAAKLASFNLTDDALCQCGQEETSYHVLFECAIYTQEASRIRSTGINELECTKVKGTFKDFKKVCTAIMKKKRTL